MTTAAASAAPRRRAKATPPAPKVTLNPVSAYALRVVLGTKQEPVDSPSFQRAREVHTATAGAVFGVDDDSVMRRKWWPDSIIAGRAVRLAGARHFIDLDHERTQDFPYYFDVSAALDIIDFFPERLSLENGDPFHLPPWLQFSYGTMYGWKCWDGTDSKTGEVLVTLPEEHVARAGYRRFIHGFFETSKGSGKALALDTPLATPGGWTTIGAIGVGDQVFDELGRVVNVIAVSDVQAGRQCLEVLFDDGSSIVADAEHLWFTEMRYGCRADGRIASAGVKLTERGGWKYGVRTTTEIARTLRYSNGKHRSANHSVPLAGPLALPASELPLEPYLLGVWLGDGDSDCGRITVGEADLELLEHIVGSGAAIGARHRGSATAPRFRIQSLTRDLAAAGLLNQKHIPAVYLRASVEQRLALLQGLMDTDGHIAPVNGECEFTSTNEDLSRGVAELLVSLGVKCAVVESAAKLYGREVSRRWRVHFHPPADLPVFRLRRKLKEQRVRHARRRLSGDRRIVDVRPVPSVPVKCITVDGPSHLFLAGRSMVPTHNTPSAAGVGLFGLSYDDEPHPEIYSTGFDKGQASIILNDGIRMAQASDDLREALIIDKYNIADPNTGGFFRAASSQHRSKSGPRPHYVLSDEIHEHRDGTVVTKMESGFKNRRQPFGLKYTNSGSDRTSYCWELHQKSMEVLERTLVDEQWFGYVCHLDPCDACYDEGYRQPKDGCPKCDDWTDPAVWPKIAPALGIVIQPKYLQDAVDAAMSKASEFSLKRRLNFCIWTETHEVWIPSDRWDACRVDKVSDGNPDGRPCAAGLDLSAKWDLTGLNIAIRFDDAPTDVPAEVVTIEGMNEEGERVQIPVTLDFSVELIPFAWIPKDTMLERVAKERIPYDVWQRLKKLFVTDGPVIDHQAIYDFIVKDVWKRYRIQRLGYDEKDATMLAVKLRDEARLGDKIVAVGQGKKLSEAFKLIEVLVRSRRLRHDGHPVMAWNFANAEPQRDRMGALWIEKPSEVKRIDLAVSAGMAIHQLMLLPAKKKRGASAFWV